MKNSKVGRSTATPIKQEHLQCFFKAQIYKTIGVFKKHSKDKWLIPTYHLFDITAGDASPSHSTSPITFLNGLYLSKGLEFKAIFVEEDKNTYNKLEQNIFNYIENMTNEEDKNYFAEAIEIINGKSEQELATYYNKQNKYKYGLLYYDANGFKKESWDTVIAFSKTWTYLDIIANISPIQIKRNLGASKNHSGFKKYNKTLPEIINQIDKTAIYIRDSINTYDQNKFQHIMLFCTNFGNYKHMENYGFCKLKSKQGQAIIKSHL